MPTENSQENNYQTNTIRGLAELAEKLAAEKETEQAAVTEVYNNWNIVKIGLELHGRQPNPAEGEIWWAGVGKNVGTEMYGKDEKFARPVLVYKKLNRCSFLAIPLSSKLHEGSWYVPFTQGGKLEVAQLHQIKVMSTKRLYRKIGEIDDTDFERVRRGFAQLYSSKNASSLATGVGRENPENITLL